MREVKLFEALTKDLVTILQSDIPDLSVVNIHGPPLCGKRKFSIDILDQLSVAPLSVSFSELANDDMFGFIDRLDGLPSCVLTEFDHLSASERQIFADYVVTISHSQKVTVENRRKRVWLVTSREPIPFIRSTYRLPDLPSHSDLHFRACANLLLDSEIDPECPLKSILVGSTRKLALGQLVALVNKAKLYAIDGSKLVSCRHLALAFNSLVLHTSPIDSVQVVPNSNHVCDFIFTRSPTSSIDDIIGLADDARAALHDFLNSETRSKILVVSGPIGCGKTHIAQTITSHSIVPAVRVTSADVLRSKIGDTEKTLFNILSANKRVILEDIDKLFPADRSESNGSVQRCLPVFLSFLDLFGNDPDRLIVCTTRHWDLVSDRLHSRTELLVLDQKLTFETKIQLIKAEHPLFDESSVTQFDLINLNNRSECMQFARNLKFSNLRKEIRSHS